MLGRYNDDISSFGVKEDAHVNQGEVQDEGENFDYKLDLFERLLQFYNVHDPNKVGGGLSRIISWTERNGWEALNQQLLDTYGADLSPPTQ